jgi:hypothetical protein
MQKGQRWFTTHQLIADTLNSELLKRATSCRLHFQLVSQNLHKTLQQCLKEAGVRLFGSCYPLLYRTVTCILSPNNL